jgi:hypothetical protein
MALVLTLDINLRGYKILHLGTKLPVTCCLYSTHDEQLSTRLGLDILPLGLWEQVDTRGL